MKDAGLPAASGVLLCAGRGRRLGGICKGRILIDGEPLVVRQLRVMQQSGLQRAVVVMGFQAQQIAEILAQAKDEFSAMEVVPLRLADDQISDDIQVSVAHGLRAAEAADAHLFMTLVDLPLLTAGHYQALRLHAQAGGADIAMPQNGAGVPGHPIFIGATALAAMPLALPGFRLREWISKDFFRVRPMITEDAAHFSDLDTAQDVAALAHEYGLKIVIPSH
ncbi:MAG: hypothetical protein FGM18_01870 [Burkholderiaceae bacterium]|nr:hypothetical protein [Burkholderiaceae bacterium]